MPGVAYQTACRYELRKDESDAAVFGNSRHQLIAGLCVLAIGLLIGSVCVHALAVGPRSLFSILPGAGLLFILTCLIALLRDLLTRRELLADRLQKRVSLRERTPLGDWRETWSVDHVEVREVAVRRGKNWTIAMVLADGREFDVDSGLQEDELKRLASYLADALDRPLRSG